jgi:cysteine desulfurase
VREPFERLAGEGFEVVSVPPESSGALDPGRLAAPVTAETVLVSVMAANNEYGGVFPIAEMAEATRRRGALFHTDAVQAVGRIPVDVRAWRLDLLACSAHKLHGPKGVGALYVRRGVSIAPHTPGGGQEKRLRAGTENTVGIVGFGRAAHLARERLTRDGMAVERLRDRFEAAVAARVTDARILGREAPRLPNTSAILFEGVRGDALLMRLDLEGVAVSVGSACSSGTLAPSPAILELGISPDRARNVVRFSLSRESTAQEIEAVVALLERVVPEARGAAPAVEAVAR